MTLPLKNRLKQIFGFAVLLFSTTAFAQQKFTADEFLQVVRAYHPVAKQANIAVKIAKANAITAQAAFDPTFTSELKNKELDGLMYYNDRYNEIKIPTWYGIDIQAGQEYISGNRLNPEETQGTLNYVGVTIPLLKNLVIDKRRAALQQARLFRSQSLVDRRLELNTLFQEALFSYWNWWEAHQLQQLNFDAYATAMKRLEMVKTTFNLGERPAIDTVEALTQVQFFYQQWQSASLQLNNARIEISAYLWKEDLSQYELPVSIVPADGNNSETMVLEQCLNDAIKHPALQQYDFKIKSLVIDRRLKFQNLLPKADFKYNQLGKEVNKVFNNPLFENNFRWGFSISVPLRFSEGRGEYAAARLKVEQTRLELSLKQVQIQNKVKQYFNDWQQQLNLLNMQQQLVQNFTLLQKGEETRFQTGESSLFLINARELKTIESKQKLIELSAKTEMNKVKLKWASGILQ